MNADEERMKRIKNRVANNGKTPFGVQIHLPPAKGKKRCGHADHDTVSGLGKLQIHDEDYCPEEIYGSLEGPMEDGRIHGVLVCTVEGDDPLPVAREIVKRWNMHDDLIKLVRELTERIASL